MVTARFVLDGLESQLSSAEDGYGLLRHDGLRAFLQYLAAPTLSARSLLTSQFSPADLRGFTTVHEHDVGGIAPEAARVLLRSLGVDDDADDADLDRFCAACTGTR